MTMPLRAAVALWAAVAVVTVLLGAAIATVKQGLDRPADVVLIGVCVAGVLCALLVAGRVVWVVGRAQRR
jgi:hypothetical protein